MARQGLTVSKIEKAKEPGRYSDGNCLFLVVPKSGGKYFVCRVTIHGKQTDLGLGGASYTSLQEAREQAAAIRKVARAGGDPRLERNKERYTVRRQGFWNQGRPKLIESLAHLVGLIMRRAGGDASAVLRVSFV